VSRRLRARFTILVRMLRLLPLLYCFGAAAPPPPPPAVGALNWKVALPFRLFTKLEDWTRIAPHPCSNSSSPPSCDRSVEQWYTRVFAAEDAQSGRWPELKNLAWHPGALLSYREKSYRPGYYRKLKEYMQPKYYLVDIAVPARLGAKQCSVVVPGHTDLKVLCKDARVWVPREGAEVQVFVLPEHQLVGSAPIRVTDLLVVGLGDSFASGEGNPDRPAGWQTSRLTARHRKDKRWIEHYNPLGQNDALWLDEQCHRSLYSYQNLAAMWLAAQDPHRAVTFVHLSCSGAEIRDGLLRRQTGPPGGGGHVAKSQLKSLNQILCTKGQSVGTLPCQQTRQIDLLLLSIGGNDVGFGHIINQYLVPPRDGHTPALAFLIRELIAAGMDRKKVSEAKAFITKELMKRYGEMTTALLAHTRPNPPKSVLLTAYPDPLRREDGMRCALRPGRDSMFEGLRYSLKLPSTLIFAIKEDAERLIEEEVISPLREVQQKAAIANRANKWIFVDGFIGTLGKHGMCAVADPNHAAEELGWPYPDGEGKWAVLNPSQWRAYKGRARWFRTVHDSMLTQRSRDFRAELHGAFHPAAQAHAAMAKAVVEALVPSPPR
jgi:hypothetical protein